MEREGREKKRLKQSSLLSFCSNPNLNTTATTKRQKLHPPTPFSPMRARKKTPDLHQTGKQSNAPSKTQEDDSRMKGMDDWLASITRESERGGKKLSSYWQDALYNYIRFPSKLRDRIVWESKEMQCVAIQDKYPKARHHYLVLPIKEIESISNLTIDDLPILENMEAAARALIKQITANDPQDPRNSENDAKSHARPPHPPPDSICGDVERRGGEGGQEKKSKDISSSMRGVWRVGYHTIPSLKLLHLHVISTDFHSPCLKNRKHWQSFTTPFFIDSPPFLKSLREIREKEARKKNNHNWNKTKGNSVSFESFLAAILERGAATEILKKEPMRCFHCKKVFKTIPKMKHHLEAEGGKTGSCV